MPKPASFAQGSLKLGGREALVFNMDFLLVWGWVGVEVGVCISTGMIIQVNLDFMSSLRLPCCFEPLLKFVLGLHRLEGVLQRL